MSVSSLSRVPIAGAFRSGVLALAVGVLLITYVPFFALWWQ